MEVLEIIASLENSTFIYGNNDRYMLDMDFPSVADMAKIDDPNTMNWLLHFWCDLSWTVGAIAKNGWMDWLAQLPLEIRRILPDGTSVLLVHARPGEHNGKSLTPDLTDDEVWELFGHVPEDLIFIGHTHKIQERRINGKHIFNPGCIGKPTDTDVRATYAILEADENGYSITPHFVEYNIEPVIEQLYQFKYPTPDYVTQFYRGDVVPPWEEEKV